MNVTRDRAATVKGSTDWFTGDVYVDFIKQPNDASPTSVGNVHFAPGARTAWHTHPHGQTLYVLEGVGYVGRRGGAHEEIRAGDIVTINPGEEHWHGATATNFMAHIAINDVDENGSPASWGEHVTEAEYGN